MFIIASKNISHEPPGKGLRQVHNKMCQGRDPDKLPLIFTDIQSNF